MAVNTLLSGPVPVRMTTCSEEDCLLVGPETSEVLLYVTMYPAISPFLSRQGTRSHEMVMLVPLVETMLRDWGIPEGSVDMDGIIDDIIGFMSLLFPCYSAIFKHAKRAIGSFVRLEDIVYRIPWTFCG